MGPLAERRQDRTDVLLSCSHVFHSSCVRALEAFNIDALDLCPVCRAPYTARPYERLDDVPLGEQTAAGGDDY